MDSEITIDLITNKTWWVRFNQDTGKISRVSVKRATRELQPQELEFETENALCDRILRKTFALRKCGVFWDDHTNGWNIGPKGTTLKLDYSRFKRFLELKPNGSPLDNDLFITVYKRNQSADVTINLNSVKRSMNLSDIQTVKKSKDTHLNIYFTKRNDPDYLIAKMEVDAEELINERSVTLDLTEVSKHSDWDEISIYTRPIFKRYGMNILDERVISSLDRVNKQVIRSCTKDDIAHIYVSKQGKNFVVENNLGSEYHLTQNSGKDFRFLVCDGELDNIAGGFSIRNSDLASIKSFTIPIGFRWPDNPVIYYKSKDIKVKDLGEQYA